MCSKGGVGGGSTFRPYAPDTPPTAGEMKVGSFELSSTDSQLIPDLKQSPTASLKSRSSEPLCPASNGNIKPTGLAA